MDKYAWCVSCDNLYRLEELIEIEVEDKKPCQTSDGDTTFLSRKQKICSDCKADIDGT